MKQWYCHVNGAQHGPLDEQTLRTWIAETRVGPNDLVWMEGMPDWVAASAIFADLFAGSADLWTTGRSMVPKAPPGGTSGATPNAELTAQARKLLRGRWGLAFGFSLWVALIQQAPAMVPYLGSLVQVTLRGPFLLGQVVFFLTFARRRKPEIGMMFHGFRTFGRALWANGVIGMFILLWTLLLIVPGIIAAYAYSQTFYLLADDKSLGVLDAIRRSKEMMRGYKWKLALLGVRFFGWALLCILTLGIGFLWLMPYMWVCYARFHDDLHPPKGQAALVTVPVEAQAPIAGMPVLADLNEPAAPAHTTEATEQSGLADASGLAGPVDTDDLDDLDDQAADSGQI